MNNIDRIKMYIKIREHTCPIHNKYRFLFHLEHFSDNNQCVYSVSEILKPRKEAYFTINLKSEEIKVYDNIGFEDFELLELIRILHNWLHAEVKTD